MMDLPPLPEAELAQASLPEIHAALFAQLVAGHGQMALTFLGRLPNPQTGEPDEPNAEAAKLFIDQLEMLVAKTKGNLSADEERLLRQTLTTTQLAFLEVFEAQLGSADAPAPAAAGTAPA
jgi:hypothetical protein